MQRQRHALFAGARRKARGWSSPRSRRREGWPGGDPAPWGPEMRCCASSPAEPRGILAAALGAGTSSWLCLLSGAAPRTPSWCTSCSVLGSPQLRCRHPRPRSAQPCPIPALPYSLFLQSGTDAVGRRSPPRSPLSRTVLRCARPHCAVPAAAVRERRSERRGRPPPTAPAPRWGAEGWGKRALCSALAADRHLAPRSQICRASISPPSADLRLGSVGLFCWFFFFPSRPRIFIAEEDKLSGRAGSARPHAAEERG